MMSASCVSRWRTPPPATVPRRRARQAIRASAGPSRSASAVGKRLDRLDAAALHPFRHLDQAETLLNGYCSALGPDQETEKCWQAYSFLERQCEKARADCDPSRPQSCVDLARLDDMMRDLLASGNVENLVAAVSTLARVDELRAARAARQQGAADAAGTCQAVQAPAADPVHELFARLDRDGDGRLSLAEFRLGMAQLGEELDGATAALIGEAMDLHGHIDEAQFRDVLDAERLNSHSQVSAIWRHHSHPRPGWWSSPPSGKGSMLT